MKRVLFTQNHLLNFGGSEIVTLELTEYFRALGYEVTVYAHVFGNPIKEAFDSLGVNVVIDPTALETEEPYDICWIHHQVIPIPVLKKLQRSTQTRVIFFHMSPFEPYEYSFLPRIELVLADAILANSEETKSRLVSGGLPDDRIEVFPNFAPDSFFSTDHVKRSRLTKIAVISNHPPQDLLEAVATLSRDDIETVRFGLGGDRYEQVKPSVLFDFDAVVTIGKTVQYCLALGVPVYCYDHFGGPGYLTVANFESAKRVNFSGRCSGLKSARQIALEIQTEHEKAKEEVARLRELHSEEFRLSSVVNRALEIAASRTNKPVGYIDEHDASAAMAVFEILDREVKSRHSAQAEYAKVSQAYSVLNERHSKLINDHSRLGGEHLKLIEAINLERQTAIFIFVDSIRQFLARHDTLASVFRFCIRPLVHRMKKTVRKHDAIQ